VFIVLGFLWRPIPSFYFGRLETKLFSLATAAVEMTLCELETAKHHSIPLECTLFRIPKEGLGVPSDTGASLPDLLRECVG
jgi:hypothetical protein